MSARAASRGDAQLALPGAGRKRKRPAQEVDPRVAALLADRDAWLSIGGRRAWEQELARRRAARVARLRDRRRNGYRDPAGGTA